MNYLAHLYLAENSEGSMLGNLLGDFVKGYIDHTYNKEISKGIRMHRRVDAFTDSHEKFLASKRLISKERRRFAGIIIDMSFDHFLAKNWSSYSSVELSDFINKAYNLLIKHASILPNRLRLFIPRMIEEDWIGSYERLEGIGKSLDGISRRLKKRFDRDNSLLGAVEEVEANYRELESNFKVFFPKLVLYVERYRQTDIK